MAADAVYDAIKTYLETPSVIAGLAHPTTTVIPPIRFENEPFDLQATPAEWINMALEGVLYGQESIGASEQSDNRWDETGRLYLSVLVPTNTGASRARQLAKLLADLFRGLRLLSDSLEFFESFIGYGRPSDDDGNYFEIPVVIDYRRWDA